jgi:branched-chain amino acid transport system ATP-binding protein
LAPIIVQQIFETLRRINRDTGTTLLIVEQNAHVALKNADFGYVLQIGRVAVAGKSEELKQNREVIESYMGSQR